MARGALEAIILGASSLSDLVGEGLVEVAGDADAAHELFGLLDTFDFWFNIVTP